MRELIKIRRSWCGFSPHPVLPSLPWPAPWEPGPLAASRMAGTPCGLDFYGDATRRRTVRPSLLVWRAEHTGNNWNAIAAKIRWSPGGWPPPGSRARPPRPSWQSSSDRALPGKGGVPPARLASARYYVSVLVVVASVPVCAGTVRSVSKAPLVRSSRRRVRAHVRRCRSSRHHNRAAHAISLLAHTTSRIRLWGGRRHDPVGHHRRCPSR